MPLRKIQINRRFKRDYSKPISLPKEMKDDGWEDRDNSIWVKVIRVRKWPSLGLEVRTEQMTLPNEDWKQAVKEAGELKAVYTLDSGHYVGTVKEIFPFIKKYGIKPEVIDDDHNVCSIGFSNSKKAWFGWSHRAVSGFKPGMKIKKGDVVCKNTGGSYPSGYEIKDMEDAKKVAIDFALQVSHNLKDANKLIIEQYKKALKDFDMGYEIKPYNGEKLSDKPTFLAVDTEDPEELDDGQDKEMKQQENFIAGHEVGNVDVSQHKADLVHADNASYDRDPDAGKEDKNDELQKKSDAMKPESPLKQRKKNSFRKGLKTSSNRHKYIRENIRRQLKRFGVI